MRTFFLIVVLTCFAAAVYSQQDNKEDLQQTKLRLQKEIEQYRELLAATQKNKKRTMGQLSLINAKINARLRIVDNINRQVKLIDDDIYRKEVEKNRLRRELDTLKLRYATSMSYAYRNRSTYDYLNFIFSATSINDALTRMSYLKAYRSYREQQADNIFKTQGILKDKINVLNDTKKQKGEVLNEQKDQLDVLEEDKKEKDQIVKELKSREKEINTQIASRKLQQRKIDNAINAIIERERREAALRAKRDREEKERALKAEKAEKAGSGIGSKTSAGTAVVRTEKTGSTTSGSPKIAAPEAADIVMSGRFEDNRGNLPWPVDGPNTVISIRFGVQHIDGTSVTMDNHGLTFQTNVGTPVKSIFDGVVSSIINLDGRQVVFIRHGKYLSGYSGLSSVSVSNGQEVKTGQVIGKAGANDDGYGETELRLSPIDKGGYLNPEVWLRRGK